MKEIDLLGPHQFKYRPDMVGILYRGFPERRQANARSGLEAFTSGNVEVSRRYRENDLKRKLVVAAVLDAQTTQEFRERVGLPFETAAERHRLRVVTPNNGDVPPHITVATGKVAQDTDLASQEEEIEALIAPGSRLGHVAGQLRGMRLPLDNIVLGQASYVCIGNPGRSVDALQMVHGFLDVRYQAAAILEAAGLEVPSYMLLHATSARITEINKDSDLQGFVTEAYTIGRSLRKEPLVATIGSIIVDTSYNHVMRTNSELIDPK